MAAPMDLSHARSVSSPPTPSAYADWERAHSRDRRTRSRAGTAQSSPRTGTSIAEEEPDNVGEAPPAYSRASKPPKYSRAAHDDGKPRLAHTASMPVAESSSVSQRRFPSELPARGYAPQGIMDMGGIRRYTDGRRPCRVGRDGKCECGKQVMRPETEEARMARRKDQFNMKGKSFWGMMGGSFAR